MKLTKAESVISAFSNNYQNAKKATVEPTNALYFQHTKAKKLL